MTDRTGFTLLELMAVMAIVVLLLTLALPSFVGWGRSAAVSRSAESVRATLDAARQRAVSRCQPITVTFSNAPSSPPQAICLVEGPDGRIGDPNRLAPGVEWTNTVSMLTFSGDGSCDLPGWNPVVWRLR